MRDHCAWIHGNNGRIQAHFSLLCTFKGYFEMSNIFNSKLNIQLEIGNIYIFAKAACRIALECTDAFKK